MTDGRRRVDLVARAALIVAVLAAFALRLWSLGDVPFGFHPDEGHNALDALAIADGWRPAFLPGNNGREPMFMYLMAGLLSVAGPSIWAVRLAGAFAGTLVVPAVYALVRALPWPGARRAAIVAACLAATLFWPVAQSRYALRAGLLPMWTALVLWAWWRLVSDDGRTSDGTHRTARDPHPTARDPLPTARDPQRHAHPAGRRDRRQGIVVVAVCLAGAAYTHMTGRLLPLVLAASAVWAVAAAWRTGPAATGGAAADVSAETSARAGRRRRRLRPLAWWVAVVALAGVLVAPQIAYFARHPEMLSYRADQVSVLNPEVNEGDLWGTLAKNAWRLARTPLVQGDASWYHNLARRPVFDPLTGTAFAVGLALVARDLVARGVRPGRRRSGRPDARRPWSRGAAVLLVASLVVTTVPSWLSVGAPNYVRLTGTWPALFAIAAYGLDRLGWAAARWRGERLGTVVVATCLAIGALWSAADYFARYADHPEVYAAFNGAAVERGRAIADVAREGPTYVSPALWRQSVVRFLNHARPPASFDLGAGLLAPAGQSARYAFDPVETAAADRFAAAWPAFQRSTPDDRRGEPSLHLFRAGDPAAAMSATAGALPDGPALFGEAIEVVGAAVQGASPVRPGTEVTVTLLARVRAPTTVDHNLFVHLVSAGGADPAVGRTVGQFDGPPLAGSLGTDRWRPGDLVWLTAVVPVPADAPPGPAELRIGWYDWRTGERLPLAGDDDGAAVVARATVATPE